MQQLCKDDEVGFVGLSGSFVAKEEMYVGDGRYLSGKGAAFLLTD